MDRHLKSAAAGRSVADLAEATEVADGADLAELADVALRLAESDPRQARWLALTLLGRGAIEDQARCTAFRAAALACIQLGELDEARQQVTAGLAIASSTPLPRQLGELQATSALLWFHAELPDRALNELDAALDGLEARDTLDRETALEAAAPLYGQRAHLLFRLGRYEEGLADTDRALATLSGSRAGGTETIEARVLSNRAIAHIYRGCYAPAMVDLARALDLHSDAGAELLVAQVLHNLGFVATRLGDVPLALRRFDEALVAYVRLGLPTHQLMVDRCELLTMARLIPEARRAAAEAADALEKAGLAADAADARLSLAEACMADQDLPAAVEAAAEAELAFERQGRHAWAVLARDVQERVHRAGLAEPLTVHASASRSVAALEGAGWHLGALDGRVAAARAALAAGRSDLARAALQDIAAGAGTGTGAVEPPVAERVLRMHAAALERLAIGQPGAALDALRQGLEPRWPARRACGRRPARPDMVHRLRRWQRPASASHCVRATPRTYSSGPSVGGSVHGRYIADPIRPVVCRTPASPPVSCSRPSASPP